jgi:putative transposase
MYIGIASATDEDSLSDILRDFKKFTSKAIIETIKEIPESRREWLLNLFWYAGKNNKKIKNFKVWQDGNDAKEIHSTAFLEEKMNYIHENPVRAEIVSNPVDYLYSSALYMPCTTTPMANKNCAAGYCYENHR